MSEVPKRKKVDRASRVGMPVSLLLQEFGQLVADAFDGEVPYHVGSSLTGSRDPHDVDVRLILSDAEYEVSGYGHPDRPHLNAKWRAMVRAFSALGREVTGLPIDFQIQQMTAAAKIAGPRSALFVLTIPPETKP